MLDCKMFLKVLVVTMYQSSKAIINLTNWPHLAYYNVVQQIWALKDNIIGTKIKASNKNKKKGCLSSNDQKGLSLPLDQYLKCPLHIPKNGVK